MAEGKPAFRVGILTISDAGSKGERLDTSGDAISETMARHGFHQVRREIVPDERELVSERLAQWCDEGEVDVVLTTGGTGLGPRDVTPEATEIVCQKILPGFGEQMRTESLRFVPTAILSRQTAGIRNQTLIVNLPGKPKSIRECLDAVFPAIPYCVDLIEGPYLETDPNVIKSFRPKK